MKILVWICFICSVGSIIGGLFVDSQYSEQFVGSGVVGLFVVTFPLFSYYRWKDKKVSDYMLTKDTLEKMQDFED